MKGLSAETEKRIVDLARAGDRAACRQIYDWYSKYLTAVCSRFIRDRSELHDVLQDGFLRIFGSLGSFEYRGEGSLRAWARQIVVNEALKRLRGRKKTTSLEYMPEIPDQSDEQPEEGVESIPAKELQRMIQELPDGYRTIFNLYVIEQKSHKEIASMLGITESTSASQLHRARAILARKIKDYRNKLLRQ
ncbi:MAG: RNA polymerase sigma factor [Candidatus Cryptobacteroides sp.]